MNVFVKADGHVPRERLSIEPGDLTKSLPFEIFELIFSNLDNLSLQRASLVNRLWNRSATETVKRIEFFKFKSFTTFLGSAIPHVFSPTQISNLNCIARERIVLEPNSLLQLKPSICECKEQIINLLKNVDEEGLKDLEKLSEMEFKPVFFKNIFALAKIFKQIDEAFLNPDLNLRGFPLHTLSGSLLQSHKIYDTYELRSMPNGSNGSYVHFDLCKALRASGNVDKACEVSLAVPYCKEKRITLGLLLRALAQRGAIDKALGMIDTIPYENEKNEGFKEVSRGLREDGNIVRALKVAHTIPDELQRERALLIITNVISVLIMLNPFKWTRNLDRAQEIASKIPDSVKKRRALEYLSKALSDSGHVSKALEVANTIPDSLEKRLAFSMIYHRLIESGNIATAIELTNTIPDALQRRWALMDLLATLAKTGNIDKALEIANTIPDCKEWLLSSYQELLQKLGV
jgi:hypothetical protein